MCVRRPKTILSEKNLFSQFYEVLGVFKPSYEISKINSDTIEIRKRMPGEIMKTLSKAISVVQAHFAYNRTLTLFAKLRVSLKHTKFQKLTQYYRR